MANIDDKVARIRQAIYGKDVRESIASGIEAINDETESTTARQTSLETTFEQLIINAGNSNAEIVDARGGFDTLRKKLDSYAINVKDFGAKGDGVTDDTTAIQNALIAAQQGTRVVPVIFPIGNYITSAPLNMYNGMTLLGAGPEREFGRRTSITNTVTSIFQFPGADVADIVIENISFFGSTSMTTSFFPDQPLDASGRILSYSSIRNCGFNYFNTILKTRILGCMIENNYFNHATTYMYFAGSDSTIKDNFLGGRQDNLSTNFIVILSALGLSRFINNYVTGWHACPLEITNGCEGTVIQNNWLDVSDGAGLYLYGAKNIIVSNNFFRSNLQLPFGMQNGIITIINSDNIAISNNTFIDEPVNVNTIALRAVSSVTSNIKICNNIYKSPHSLKIYYSDTELANISNISVLEPGTNYMSGTARYPFMPAGAQYFDTTLGKPIFYNGTNWVDANGTVV